MSSTVVAVGMHMASAVWLIAVDVRGLRASLVASASVGSLLWLDFALDRSSPSVVRR
jgi:hypothetical protein